MASTPEGRVKQKVTKQLKELGVYYFYPATGGYGRSGVPDIIFCYAGLFFAIECKAGNNKPTPLQQKNITEIREAGGAAWVVNEENVDKVIDVVRTVVGAFDINAWNYETLQKLREQNKP